MQFCAADSLDRVFQQLLFSSDLFLIVLSAPLKCRPRLRHERGYADGHAETGTALIFRKAVKAIGHFFRKARNPENILIRFRRQPDHKIQLDAAPSGCECVRDRAQQILFRYVLVDHVTQALRACFRCKRQPAFSHGLHLFKVLFEQRIDTQRRQRDGHPLFCHIVHDPREQLVQFRIVAGRKGQQGNFVISRTANQIAGLF